MINKFRTIAILEGISYLVLLGIAMPLKYFGGMPKAVLYTGWVHGLLFVLYMLFLGIVFIKYKWPFKKGFYAFIASLLPFGPFIFERKMMRNEKNNQ